MDRSAAGCATGDRRQRSPESGRHLAGGKGLSFLASAKILPDGGTQETFPERILVVETANAATIVVAAGTSFRGNDPIRAAVDAICSAAAAKPLRAAARGSRRRSSAAVSARRRLRLGQSSRRQPDRRAARARQARRVRPRARRAVFPVRPLPADRQQPAGRSAGEPAGALERQHEPAVGQRLSPQHQPADELLAGRGDQPRRAARAAVRLSRVAARARAQDGAVHYGARGFVAHHITDIWGFTSPGDLPRSGLWPTGAAWLAQHLWEHYLFNPIARSSRSAPIR